MTAVMDHSGTLLFDLALVLGMAGVTTVLCRLLRQPVVLGYLLAGLIVGPYVPIPLFADAERVATLSELGVILVMFGIGLEFTVGRLLRILPRTGIVASLQIGTLLWLGYFGGRITGWSRLESMFLGAALSISSTMIVAKVLAERRAHWRLSEIVYSVLVLQDFAAIVFIAVLTAMASGASTGADMPPGEVAFTVGRLMAFLVVMVAVGFLVVPRAVRRVAALESPETLLVACIGLCFALAELAQFAGFSVALGAFLAGSLVAESGRSREVEHLVGPVRDVFAAVFFVTVGMSVDPASLALHPGTIVLLSALVIVGQMVSVSIGSFLAGYGLRQSIQASTILTQIGEFSFILVGIGLTAGVVSPELFSIVVATSAITSILTPWLAKAGRPLALFIDRNLPSSLQTYVSLYGAWLENLRGSTHRRTLGMIVRRSLRWLVLDSTFLSGAIIAASLADDTVVAWLDRSVGAPAWLAHLGLVVVTAACCAPFVMGISRLSVHLGAVLARAAMPRAESDGQDTAAAPRRAYVVTIQLTVALFVLVPVGAITQPFVPPWWSVSLVAGTLLALTIVFWRGTTGLSDHARAGAEAIAEALQRHARGNDQPDRSSEPTGDVDETTPDLSAVSELLPGLGTLVDVTLPEDSHVVGRSLRDINLRGHTGATVFAIGRGTAPIAAPDGNEPLAAGDRLCLAGSQAALAAARVMLLARQPQQQEQAQAG